ncbi:neural cell adhesion molecule 1 isoform X2 [Brachyhypopomus gauderio]|uniref:neural cell adhesion molecule 1 isoform X2 n=1 Tax=Brachyhypopomus gauderio TaxID=698409 RepID=UPI0040437C76
MAAYLMILTLFVVFFINSRLTDAKVDLIISDPEVRVGSDHLILCKAGKDAEIQWQKDGEDIDEDRYIVESIDETSSKVLLKSVTLDDRGTYKCICNYGNHEDEAAVNIFVYEMPNFGNTQKYHEFLVNETAQIPCLVSGKPEVDINWYRNRLRIINGPGHQSVLPDGTLQIANIQREDSGTYVCEGRIRGRKILRTLDISIVVNAPATAMISIKKASVFAGPNTNVTIICLVTGLPAPIITWSTPPTSDSSRYIYNSDKSELIIPAVVRNDAGKYICTAQNKIGEDGAIFELDVSEIPLVTLSQKKMAVGLGGSILIYCDATGHPVPTITWRRKGSSNAMPSVGRQRVEGSKLIIEKVAPSDGGVYTCDAHSSAVHSTEDFSLITAPEVPSLFRVSPGPTSAHITLNTTVLDGGSPLTNYVLQWRKQPQDKWAETNVPPSSPLVVKALAPYTEYFIRFAAQNNKFLGGFSAEHKIRTQAKREPDRPMLSNDEKVIEENSFSIPFKQLDDGGSPIKRYVVRYRKDKEGEDWREKEMAANSTKVYIPHLQYGSDYLIEVLAVNTNGISSPAKLKFSVPQVETKGGLGKAGVVGIVMVIFLVLLLSVDAFCCYKNRCGLLNFLSRKMLVHKMSVSKSVEEGVINNAAVKPPANGEPTVEA